MAASRRSNPRLPTKTAGSARCRRADALPWLHRHARPYSAGVVSGSAARAQGRAGFYYRADQPRWPRSCSRVRRPLESPTRLPAAARRPGPGAVDVVDVRGVPRCAGRHATCDHARALHRAQRGARLRHGWRQPATRPRGASEDARKRCAWASRPGPAPSRSV